MLGAGRAVKESVIDYSAGIVLDSKVGDYVNIGDTIATIYADKEELFRPAVDTLTAAIEIGAEKPEIGSIIIGNPIK